MYRSTTVITAPVVTALTTVDAVTLELKLTGAANLARAATLIDQASQMIVDFCGRSFASARVMDTFNVDRGGYPYRNEPNLDPMILSRSPVTNVVSVIELESALAVTLYDLDFENGLLYRPLGGYSTAITYDGGYLLPGQVGRTLPMSVERACIDTISALWFRTKRGDPMLRSESVDGIGSSTYMNPALASMAGLPPMAAGVLSQYRNIRA